MQRWQQSLHRLLEPATDGDWSSKSVDLFLLGLVGANCTAAVLETLPAALSYRSTLAGFERISIFVFTLEYLLRLWSCPAGGYSPWWGRLRYALTPLLLLDLATILPFYLSLLGMDLRPLRMVRMVRFIYIAKLTRYSRALQVLARILRLRLETLMMTLLLALLVLLLSATLMYHAEHKAQPEVFSSIPASFWWAVTTLTTVGYGDAYPITLIGKILGGLTQVIGICLFALPAGILASSFLQELMENPPSPQQPGSCPHCGEKIDPQTKNEP